MNGRSNTFTLDGQDYTLKRPSFTEMPAIVDRVDGGDVLDILLEAAGDEQREALTTALEEADHEKVTTFWDEYKAFMGYQAFLDNWLAPREREQAKRQAVMFTEMKRQGLISETMIEDMVKQAMTPSEAGTTSMELLTGGLQS